MSSLTDQINSLITQKDALYAQIDTLNKKISQLQALDLVAKTCVCDSDFNTQTSSILYPNQTVVLSVDPTKL